MIIGAVERPPVEVTSELHDVFDPLCTVTAQALEADAPYPDPALHEKLQAIEVHVLPSDIRYMKAGWDALQGIDYPAGIAYASLDDKIAFLHRIRDNFFRLHPEEFDRPWYDDRLSSILSGVEHTVLAKDFDLDTWRHYEQRMEAFSPETRQQIVFTRGNRARNSRNGLANYHLFDLPGVTEHVYARNPFIPPEKYKVIHNMYLPIGAYGQEFATDLLKTAIHMQAFAQEYAYETAEHMTADNEELLRQYTARGNEAREVSADSTMETLQEGILTIAQSIALLTCEKVPGYDDPHELVKAIAEAGLVERLARYASMGLVGPLVLGGKYVPGALQKTAEGGLEFSPAFEDLLKTARAKFIAQHFAKQKIKKPSGYIPVDPNSTRNHKLIGRICPVAGKDGGIERLINTFSHLL